MTSTKYFDILTPSPPLSMQNLCITVCQQISGTLFDMSRRPLWKPPSCKDYQFQRISRLRSRSEL